VGEGSWRWGKGSRWEKGRGRDSGDSGYNRGRAKLEVSRQGRGRGDGGCQSPVVGQERSDQGMMLSMLG
jgi:hypothetical protein